MINAFSGRYIFLSNFYPCYLEFEGRIYPTVEHAYQASKMRTQENHEAIRCIGSPREAKQLARKLPMREDFEDVKVQLMTVFVREKFKREHNRKRNMNLDQKLIATYPVLLVEGNTWGDTFWGYDTRLKRGDNLLGRILMSVRDELC